MFLVNPATYLSVAAFLAEANDYDLTGYTNAQLQDMLVRASGTADSYMRRSYLPQEVTEQFEGDGTNTLALETRPIIYVKTVELVMPGFAPFALPLGQLMIDYERGTLRTWSPLIFETLGVANVFPRNGLPIMVCFAYGYGWPIPAPGFSLGTAANGLFASGSYNVVVTTRTYSGESLPSAAQIIALLAGQGINVGINPQPGAYVYRIYASNAQYNASLAASAVLGATTLDVSAANAGMTIGSQWLLDDGSVSPEVVTIKSVSGTTVTLVAALVSAHTVDAPLIPVPILIAESPATNYGQAILTVTLTSLSPSAIGSLVPPTADTSMWPIPNGIVEAVRMLTLAILWEQNNLSNRGLYRQGSGRKALMWRSTEGMSGRGKPLMVEQAELLLAPYSMQAIF